MQINLVTAKHFMINILFRDLSKNDNRVINLNSDNTDSHLYIGSFLYRLKNSHLVGVHYESLTVDNWAIHLWNTIFIPLLTKQTLFVISAEFETQYEHKLWEKINIYNQYTLWYKQKLTQNNICLCALAQISIPLFECENIEIINH